MQPYLARVGGAAAIIGALTLFVATLLHPMEADPNDPAAAFAEYAADSLWMASHLGQFLGVVGLAVGLVGLGAAMEPGRASVWARLGVIGAAASLAATAALQAVDGVALKIVVDRWAEASGDARARAFEAAFAVRQVEVGLASLVSLLFGLTVSAFGIAMLLGRRFPRWLGWLAMAGGIGTVAAGVAQAYTGFSALAMTLSMPAGVALLLWAIAVGACMWRLAPRLTASKDAP